MLLSSEPRERISCSLLHWVLFSHKSSSQICLRDNATAHTSFLGFFLASRVGVGEHYPATVFRSHPFPIYKSDCLLIALYNTLWQAVTCLPCLICVPPLKQKPCDWFIVMAKPLDSSWFSAEPKKGSITFLIPLCPWQCGVGCIAQLMLVVLDWCYWWCSPVHGPLCCPTACLTRTASQAENPWLCRRKTTHTE